ncbi:MAG: hypothetical protein V4584_18580 [Verrucomicrobiota bacterium]
MKKILLALLGIAIVVFFAGLGLPRGRRTVVDNRPLLKNSVLIDHFEAPNLVVTSKGDRLHVEGVLFDDRMIELPPNELKSILRDQDSIRIAVDPAQPSGVAVELRMNYWCGNSFHQTSWPKPPLPPLPGYVVADFGKTLLMRSLASVNRKVISPFNDTIKMESEEQSKASRTNGP